MTRVVFMGTPEFAVPSLDALLDAGYEVVGAFTQPDRPSGRGHKLAACPVKQRALERGVPVYQFERVRGQKGLAYHAGTEARRGGYCGLRTDSFEKAVGSARSRAR